jgi:hypothetical protein
MGVTPEQLLEQTLVIRSQLGDEAAFAELLTLGRPRLLRFHHNACCKVPHPNCRRFPEIWVAIFRACPS